MDSYEYQVRIHSDPRRDDDVINWLKKRATAWYLAYETSANRSHYQMYMKSKYKEQSLRRYIKEELQLEGNRMYAISKLKKEPKDLVCYLMKEGEMSLVSKNICSTIVRDAESQANEIKETKAKPSNKFKTTVSQIMETIPPGTSQEDEIICYIYAFYWKRQRLIPDQIQINKYARTIKAYIGGGEAICEMINDHLWTQPSKPTDLMNQLFLFETE